MPAIGAEASERLRGSVARLLDVAAMRGADERAIAAGTPGVDLMERAGAHVAQAALEMAPAGGRIAVVCGPGNNGGDGFVAARLLQERGYRVALGLLGDRARLTGDAGLAAARWSGPVADARTMALDADLIIDALFGAGLARDLDGDAKALVARVNGSGVAILAVDLPSGVDGDTGAIRGAAVRAQRSVTFVRLKPGHLLYPGRALCGPTAAEHIGVADSIVAAAPGDLYLNDPTLWRDALPELGADSHKYRRGHALVVAGGLESVGAPRLSARTALRIGAGLVTIAAPTEALAAHAARGPDALMLRRMDGAADLRALLDDPRRNAAVIGPALGLDNAARRLVDIALASAAACVLDADALTLLAGDVDAIAGAAKRKPIVLTPHDGEFARLFKEADLADDIRAELASPSKPSRAQAAARITGAIVVLKGPDTVIAAPDGRAAINANAPPWLATAGSGDVLAGAIGGLLAQGMPAWDAACAAVWLHGEAANRIGRGLIADDLPDEMGRALAVAAAT